MTSAATACRWSRPPTTRSGRSAPAWSAAASCERARRRARWTEDLRTAESAVSAALRAVRLVVRMAVRCAQDHPRVGQPPLCLAELMGICRIIPLGGLGEVGKNMTVYEADDSIVVVDAGLAFPRDEHLGVDLVLPDFTYLREREHMIKGVVLTHGHEDHVGSLPYLMREVRIPVVVATRLTLGLVKSKLDEHGLLW